MRVNLKYRRYALMLACAVLICVCRSVQSVSADTVSGGDVSVSAGDVLYKISEKMVTVSGGDAQVLKVLLPTDFVVLLYHEGGRLKFESQDILLINKGDVAVQLNVSGLNYRVRGESMENTLQHNSLQISVNEYGGEKKVLNYDSGVFETFSILLSGAERETDVDSLQERAKDWSPLGAVTSADYCTIRLTGYLEDATVREDELEISVVFSFEEVAEADEVPAEE